MPLQIDPINTSQYPASNCSRLTLQMSAGVSENLIYIDSHGWICGSSLINGLWVNWVSKTTIPAALDSPLFGDFFWSNGTPYQAVWYFGQDGSLNAIHAVPQVVGYSSWISEAILSTAPKLRARKGGVPSSSFLVASHPGYGDCFYVDTAGQLVCMTEDVSSPFTGVELNTPTLSTKSQGLAASTQNGSTFIYSVDDMGALRQSIGTGPQWSHSNMLTSQPEAAATTLALEPLAQMATSVQNQPFAGTVFFIGVSGTLYGVEAVGGRVRPLTAVGAVRKNSSLVVAYTLAVRYVIYVTANQTLKCLMFRVGVDTEWQPGGWEMNQHSVCDGSSFWYENVVQANAGPGTPPTPTLYFMDTNHALYRMTGMF